MKILEIKNINKTFGKKKQVLNNISFEIEEGEMVGFVGNNGAGKTTTIRTIFNVLDADSGEILYKSKKISENKELLKEIAFFPDQNNYPKTMKILDYIVYSAELSGLKKKDVVEKAKEVLTTLGLGDYISSTFKELSAGMQKKALLASVLISKPKMIILDEPTANVDVDTRIEFLGVLTE